MRYLIIKDNLYLIKERTSFDRLADKCLLITDPHIEHPDDCKIETGVDEFNQEYEIVVFDAEAKQARIESERIAKEQYETDFEVEKQARLAIKNRIGSYKLASEKLQIDINTLTNLSEAKTVLTKLNTGLVNLIEDIGRIAKRTI